MSREKNEKLAFVFCRRYQQFQTLELTWTNLLCASMNLLGLVTKTNPVDIYNKANGFCLTRLRKKGACLCPDFLCPNDYA